MKKLFLILSILFSILTFAGVGYVLLSKGQANAGYTLIPLVFTLAFLSLYRGQKK